MSHGKECIYPEGCVVFDIESQIGETSIELSRLFKTRRSLDEGSDTWHAINETIKDTQYEIKGYKNEAVRRACQNCKRVKKHRR